MKLKIHKIKDKWYIDLGFKIKESYHIRREIKQREVDLLSLEFLNKFNFKYKIYVNKEKYKIIVDIITPGLTVSIGGKITGFGDDFKNYIEDHSDNIIGLNYIND